MIAQTAFFFKKLNQGRCAFLDESFKTVNFGESEDQYA
jgi:hypothetical protein